MVPDGITGSSVDHKRTPYPNREQDDKSKIKIIIEME